MYRSIHTLSVMAILLGVAGCRTMQDSPPLPSRGVPEAAGSIEKTPTVTLNAEPTGAVTLREAAALALMHNPRLAVVSLERRAADARRLQAGLRPNPELAVEIESLAGSGQRSDFDGAETTVSLGQLIERGGKRSKRLRAASLGLELADWGFQSQRLDTLHQVTQAFIRLLAAQERLTLAGQLHDLSSGAQSAVAQRVEAGKDSAVDALRAGVALSHSRIELQKATRALAAARQNLAAMWGARAASFEMAAGDFYVVAAPPAIANVNEVIAANPDLARWATEQKQRRAALDLEKAQAKADITVAAGVQRFEETDDSAFLVSLALPIPLFDRNQGRVEEAAVNLARARKEHQAVETEIAALLSQTLNDLAAAHEETEILQTDVLPKAQQAFEAAQQGYREGKFDYLYVLDTQRTFFETKVQYIDAVEACHLSRADVERLMGQALEPDLPSAG